MKLWIGCLLTLALLPARAPLAAQDKPAEKADEKKPAEKQDEKKPAEKKDDTPKAPDADSAAYFPLKEGAVWTYKADNKTTFSVKVAGSEKVKNENCTRLEYLDKDGKLIASEFVAVKADGVYRCAFSGSEADPPYLFLKFPVKDAEWNVKSSIAGQAVEGDFKATLEKEPMKVGAASYDKVVKVEARNMRIDNQTVLMTYYYAPNTGMIKQEISVAGVKIEVLLEKYEEKK